MLYIQYIETHQDEVIKRLQERGFPHANKTILDLLKKRKAQKKTLLATETTAQVLNSKSREIHALFQAGKKEQAAPLMQEVASQKRAHKELLEKLKQETDLLRETLLSIPNLPDVTVPVGSDERDNKVIHQNGQPHTSPLAIHPHWELIEKYDLASFKQGAKITGAGFPIYKGKGAKLQRALIALFLDQAIAAGYEEILPPLLVNRAAAEGTGQLPDKEGLMYMLQDPPLYLAPTAEVPLTNLYRDSLLPTTSLPIKHVAHTPCFRREAGSWGTHVRGLNRLHQFDKVELVEIHRTKAAALSALKAMITHTEGLLKQLSLTYRTVLLCSRELGHSASLTYDIEVWSPAQQLWLEVSSLSYFGDYQARRMSLRYKHQGENPYCHTINGSALALPRVVAALLERHQKEATITLPPILHPYTRFETIP